MYLVLQILYLNGIMWDKQTSFSGISPKQEIYLRHFLELLIQLPFHLLTIIKNMCDHLCILIFMSSYHSYFFLLFSRYFRKREDKYVQSISLLFNFYSFAVTDFSTMYLAHIFKNVICTSYFKNANLLDSSSIQS